MQCENVTEPDFHSVSTCTEVPDSMKWAPGRPDERGDYEFCVEYIRGYGMNDVRCESSFVKWIVCQYTRNCPSDFEMANGISDKCFMVQSAHGHKGAKKAKEFCEARYNFYTILTQNLISCKLYLSTANGFSLFIISYRNKWVAFPTIGINKWNIKWKRSACFCFSCMLCRKHRYWLSMTLKRRTVNRKL